MKKFSIQSRVVTPEEAAPYVSEITGRQVTDKTLLRHALDGELPLSVLLAGPTKVRPGCLSHDDAGYHAFMESLANGEAALFSSLPRQPALDECVVIPGSRGAFADSRFAVTTDHADESSGSVVMLDCNVAEVSGVVDLPLIGDERDHVADICFGRRSGADRHFVHGTYIRTDCGATCQLQEPFDALEYKTRRQRRAEEFKRYVIENRLQWDEEEELRQRFEAHEQAHARKLASDPLRRLYMPASRLPAGTAIVFRREALEAFASTLIVRANSIPSTFAPVKEPDEGTARAGPCWVKDPLDPAGNGYQPWYAVARYLARKLVRDDPTLLKKSQVLAHKVAEELLRMRVGKRGTDKPFDVNTVLKALVKVDLSRSS